MAEDAAERVSRKAPQKIEKPAAEATTAGFFHLGRNWTSAELARIGWNRGNPGRPAARFVERPIQFAIEHFKNTTITRRATLCHRGLIAGAFYAASPPQGYFLPNHTLASPARTIAFRWRSSARAGADAM